MSIFFKLVFSTLNCNVFFPFTIIVFKRLHSLAFNYVNIYIAVLILQLEFFDTRIFELKQPNYLRDLHFKIYGQLNLIDVSLMQMSFSKMCF